MKKKNLMALGALALGFALCSSSEPSSIETIEESVSESISEEIDDSEPETIDEEGDIEVSEPRFDLADSNGNNIPDVIEDYYDEHIRDQYLFGISLGALVAAAIGVIAGLWKINITKKASQVITDSNEKINLKFNAIIESKDRQIEELQISNAELAKIAQESSNTAKEAIIELKEAYSQIKDYPQIVPLMKANLECSRLLSNDEDYVSKGICAKINEIVEGVKEDGEQ